MPATNRPATKHTQIITAVRAGILNGTYQRDQRLPSETALGEQFQATRATVGKALRELEHAGLISRKRGSGSFVRMPDDQRMLTFAIVVTALGEGEIFEPICNELAMSLAERNHRLLWGQSSTQNHDERCQHAERLCHSYIAQKVDGVFFTPIELTSRMDEANARIADLLERAGIPVVLLDCDVAKYPRRSRFDLIGIDNHRVGHVLATHFLDAGCRHIAFACLPHSAPTVDARIAGYREALFNRGVAFQPDWIKRGDPADPAFIDALLKGTPPEAVICGNDYTAALLIAALLRRGVRIPADIRISGVDDVKYARLLAVPVTTIRQPCQAIGRAAASAMLDRIAKPDLPGRDIRLDFELVIRDSSPS